MTKSIIAFAFGYRLTAREAPKISNKYIGVTDLKSLFKFGESLSVLVAGTASGVGKNTIACGLIRLMHERGMSPVPLKPLSLEGLPCEAGEVITPSIRAQALAAGVEPFSMMNPVRVLFSSGRASRYYIHGRLQANGLNIGNALQYVNEAIAKLKPLGALVIEGQGALADTFDSPEFLAVLDGEISNIVLVADAYMGGALAAIVGTLELAPATWLDRIRVIVINRFSGSENDFPIPAWRQLLRKKFGIQIVFTMPIMSKLYAMSEDLWPMPPLYTVESDIQEVATTLQRCAGDGLMDLISRFLPAKLLRSLMGSTLRASTSPRASVRVWDSANHIVGSVDTDGKVWNGSNHIVGSVDGDGKVWSESNHIVGSVDGDGTIWSRSNHIVGSVDGHGKVWSRSNHIVGSVDAAPRVSQGGAALLLLLRT